MRGQAKNDNHNSIEEVAEFYQAIDRRSLMHKLSVDHPYVYTTMEIYDVKNGIRGAGGLGVLAADTRRCAEELDLPFVVLTPFYRREGHQYMVDFQPYFQYIDKSPEKESFTRVGETTIQVKDQLPATLDVYTKVLGTTRFVCVTEPNFGMLYQGEPSSDHRLYQMVSLGFGGYAALKLLHLKPAVLQLNETATVFAAVARLDELCINGMSLYESIVYVRKHTLYTNHTLVQAAESEFSYDQFERYVLPNVKSPALRHFLRGLFNAGRLKLSSLTIELAEAKNAVAKLHAKVADYHDLSGEKVQFTPITNGIHLDTWLQPEIIEFYHQHNIIDKFNMPARDYQNKIYQAITTNVDTLRQFKRLARKRLNHLLLQRKDQYGETVQIPEDAVLFDYKRRFVAYKRPWLPFADIEQLKNILVKYNAHYIMAGMMAGNVGKGDTTYDRLQSMLRQIAADPVLHERVHYIVDYDEALATAISMGSDVSINVPIVGLEACGTSFMKDLGNLTLLVSTNDGGVADVESSPAYIVKGDTEADEIKSLYLQMQRAAQACKEDVVWAQAAADTLAAYLPVISGSRMIRDYLKFLFKGVD